MIKRNLFPYILSFCSALFLTILAFLLLVHFMLFNQSRIYQTLETTNYYESISMQINQNLQYTSGAAGIEPNVFSNFMDAETVKEDIIKHMENSSENSTYQKRYASKLRSYLISKGYTEDEIKSEEMQEYIRIQAVDYVKHIKFPFMKYFTMAKDTIDMTFPYLLGGCSLMLLASIVFLGKGLCKQRFYQWLGYGVLGSGGMLITMPIIIFITKWVEKVNMKPVYYYRFFVRYANDFLWSMIIASLILFVIGFVLLRIRHSKKLDSSLKE